MAGKKGGFWTDERTEYLEKMVKQGLTASQMGNRLKTTRNAVIGKCLRKGWTIGQGRNGARARSSYQKAKPNQRLNFAAKPKRASPRPAPVSRVAKLFHADAEPIKEGPEIVIAADQRCGVVDLKDDQCRWPIGDPRHDDFHFCNFNKVTGLPYCEMHGRRAFQPPVVNSRKKAEPSFQPDPVRPVKLETV